jgi:hypothetical protein
MREVATCVNEHLKFHEQSTQLFKFSGAVPESEVIQELFDPTRKLIREDIVEIHEFSKTPLSASKTLLISDKCHILLFNDSIVFSPENAPERLEKFSLMSTWIDDLTGKFVHDFLIFSRETIRIEHS